MLEKDEEHCGKPLTRRQLLAMGVIGGGGLVSCFIGLRRLVRNTSGTPSMSVLDEIVENPERWTGKSLRFLAALQPEGEVEVLLPSLQRFHTLSPPVSCKGFEFTPLNPNTFKPCPRIKLIDLRIPGRRDLVPDTPSRNLFEIQGITGSFMESGVLKIQITEAMEL